MNGLKTYRNYLLYNKFLDLITYLIVFTFSSLFFIIIYYTTESFVILFVAMVLIYLLIAAILKLFEVKVLLPSIIYLVVGIVIVILVSYNEKQNINQEIIQIGITSIIFISILSLIVSLYKYETPTALYYRVKDSLSGTSFGKKIKNKYKDQDNITTNTPYSSNLMFERTKLLNKLGEDYKEEYTEAEYQLTLATENKNRIQEELKDLHTTLETTKERFKKATTGAQKFELTNQIKDLKEKIIKQKETEADAISKLNLRINKKEELENTYKQDIYYISNAYNLRYRNYTDKIQDKLIVSKMKLNIIPFDLIKMEESK